MTFSNCLKKTYIERVLKRFNMHSCTPRKALIVKGDKLLKAQCLQNDEERRHMKMVPYSLVVGSLMYVQVCTRPDIAFAIGVLGRYLSGPGTSHWQSSKDHMLTYWRTNNLDIVGFCDANFEGCMDDKNFTIGYIFMMAGGAISWKSIKQTLIASSTMETKYVACYETTFNAMWLQNFISALGVVDSFTRPLKLYCDNSTDVSFSRNIRSTYHSKHIDVKFYFVKEKVVEGLISVEYMSTNNMLADSLTKGLPICVFQEHVSHMGLVKA
ncbi:hypothetical protein UlMin_024514 [Ulmus minor]